MTPPPVAVTTVLVSYRAPDMIGIDNGAALTLKR
jgi:hypothetical protein